MMTTKRYNLTMQAACDRSHDCPASQALPRLVVGGQPDWSFGYQENPSLAPIVFSVKRRLSAP